MSLSTGFIAMTIKILLQGCWTVMRIPKREREL